MYTSQSKGSAQRWALRLFGQVCYLASSTILVHRMNGGQIKDSSFRLLTAENFQARTILVWELLLLSVILNPALRSNPLDLKPLI